MTGSQESALPAEVGGPGVRRLHWGCGGSAAPGWINSDIGSYDGVDIVCDIREGLPLEADSLDYTVSIHALPELPYTDLVPVLRELRRVLKPGGVLRLALPDLERAIRAYQSGDAGYFLIPDEDARAISAKLVMQLIWYGHSRTLFTHDFIEEQLRKAGFGRIEHCAYRVTTSAFPDIVTLDNRETESLFVEAYK